MNRRPFRPGAVPPKHPYSFPDDLPRLAPRRLDAHKGDFGRCLIIGGSLGMSGAVALAAAAALRSGAGLVRAAAPRSCLPMIAAYEPSYMTLPLAEDAEGRIAASAAEVLFQAAAAATVVAVGPGLGRSPGLDELVVRLYQELPQPAVFDADALNALAARRDASILPGGPRVLTPHVGEFARLVDVSPTADRTALQQSARAAAEQRRSVIVLKGQCTFVTDGTHGYVNNTGNPGMATGGCGDVLTGVIAALMCQGLNAYDAARLGVHVHGLAGDEAADVLGRLSLIASDLLLYLPDAMQRAIGTA